MNKVYMPVVVDLMRSRLPIRILDLPSGNGWLRAALGTAFTVDGIDLFEARPDGYDRFWQGDLDETLQAPSSGYEAVVSCEGIEHLGNPLLFLRECHRVLVPGGTVVLTTPNVWGPASKLKYLLRGFFPGFPSLAGRIERGTHMHITPFSFPWLFLYLRLAGFQEVRLHDTPARKPRHQRERLLGWSQSRYCRRKELLSATDEERRYWRDAGSEESVYGRALVVTAVKPL